MRNVGLERKIHKRGNKEVMEFPQKKKKKGGDGIKIVNPQNDVVF